MIAEYSCVTRFWKTSPIVITGLFHLLLQLIATVIHYPCTVPLSAVANQFAFVQQSLSILYIHNLDNIPHGGNQKGGIDLILTLMPLRHLSGLLGLYGPIVDAFWMQSYSKQFIYGRFSTSHHTHPIPFSTQVPSHLPPHYTGLKLVHTSKNHLNA